MMGAKTRLREKIFIFVFLGFTAVLAFVLIQRYLYQHKASRYPNVVAAEMSPTDYILLCTNDVNAVQRDLLSLGSPAAGGDKLMENHNKLAQEAKTTDLKVKAMIHRLDEIKPPHEYTSDYQGFIDQLVAIDGGLKTYESDAKAHDPKSVQHDSLYLLNLANDMKSHIPPVMN